LVLSNNGSSLVSLDGGKRLSVWRHDSVWAPASIELPSSVKKFAADRSGQIAVVSLRNGELIAYSVQDVPKLIWRVASQESSRSIQNTNKISSIVGLSKFDQDGKSVVKVGERIIPISTYDNQVDELKDRIEFEKLTSREPSVFSGNRNVFAAVDGGRLSIWATKDGHLIATLEVPKLHSAGDDQLAADATGLRYALIVKAKTFRTVDCTSSPDCGSPQSKDRELKTDSYIASIAISADGSLLAVGSGVYDEVIYLWR
jgi:WD40 repeat protein